MPLTLILNDNFTLEQNKVTNKEVQIKRELIKRRKYGGSWCSYIVCGDLGVCDV